LDGLAEILGGDRRQLARWRHGPEPCGSAMLTPCWLAREVDGLDALLGKSASQRSERWDPGH
jgi:hypothetical protein